MLEHMRYTPTARMNKLHYVVIWNYLGVKSRMKWQFLYNAWSLFYDYQLLIFQYKI